MKFVGKWSQFVHSDSTATSDHFERKEKSEVLFLLFSGPDSPMNGSRRNHPKTNFPLVFICEEFQLPRFLRDWLLRSVPLREKKSKNCSGNITLQKAKNYSRFKSLFARPKNRHNEVIKPAQLSFNATQLQAVMIVLLAKRTLSIPFFSFIVTTVVVLIFPWIYFSPNWLKAQGIIRQ